MYTLHKVSCAVFKGDVHTESVVNLFVCKMVETAVYFANTAVINHLKCLVDEVDAPVIKHSAAVNSFASPVARDAS